VSDFELEGAVALVTGAAGGIGRAICAALSARGALVVGADLKPSAADAEQGCVACDVTSLAEVEALVTRITEEHGGLDILVHAAGITRDRVLWKMEVEEWNAVMRVNLDAAFLLLRTASPHLRKSTRGAVILIASINGERGKFGQSNYAASKAGLIGLARSAARELGRDGVRVNVVAPVLIATAMTEALPEKAREQAVAETVLGRPGQPEDVADAVVFLGSNLARHITGQVLRVDGGQLIA